MGAMGQAMLTDYCAVTVTAAIMIAIALLTRRKRERELGIGETLRMICVWVAGVACLIAPAFQSGVTLTQGLLVSALIAIAELSSL
jgi:hypothetical protein